MLNYSVAELRFSDKMGYFYLELRIKIGTNLEVVPDTDLG